MVKSKSNRKAQFEFTVVIEGSKLMSPSFAAEWLKLVLREADLPPIKVTCTKAIED